MPNKFYSPAWYSPIAEAYSIYQISNGPFAGEFATTHKDNIIHISDTMQEAIDYSHKYSVMRMSAFNVDMPNLLAMANDCQENKQCTQ